MPAKNIIFSLEQVNNRRNSYVYKGREGVNKIKQVQLMKEGVLILIIWGLIVPESEIQRVKERAIRRKREKASEQEMFSFNSCPVLCHF